MKIKEVQAFEGHKITLEAEFGGYEGGGDTTWKVFKVSKQGETIQYFQTNGYYDSWNGTEWDGTIHLVEPKEVMHIEWFGTKED